MPPPLKAFSTSRDWEALTKRLIFSYYHLWRQLRSHKATCCLVDTEFQSKVCTRLSLGMAGNLNPKDKSSSEISALDFSKRQFGMAFIT